MDFDPLDRQMDSRLKGIRMRGIQMRQAALHQFDDALVNLRRLHQNDAIRHPPPPDALVCDITDRPE